MNPAPVNGNGAIDDGAAPPKGRVEEAPPPKKTKKQKEEEIKAETFSRVIVNVPAGAKLYIDGRLMKSTAAKRTFRTPTLQTGKSYFYEVRAEVVRDGQTITETQRVVVRPGEDAVASFPNLGRPTNATAQAVGQ